MSTAFVVLTIVTAVANAAAALVDFARAEWVMANMSRYGLPPRWIVPLGVVKAAGALGLLAGLVVPAVGLAAAVGLVLYFVGAVGAVVRARCYAHLPFPGVFLLLAVATLVLDVVVR